MASILSNTIISSLGRIVNVLLGVIVIGLLTRLLGVEMFGSYALILSYGVIFQTIADGGLYLTLTREIATHPDQEQDLLAHIISLRCALLCITFTVGGLLLLFIPSLQKLIPVYAIAVIGLAFQSLSQLALGVYQKYGVVWQATLGDLAGRLIQVAGIMLVSTFSMTVVAAMAIFTISTATTAAFHQRLVTPLQRIVPKVSLKTWRQLLRSSWPLAALLMLNVVYFRVDMIILSLVRTTNEVGLYGAAYRLIESMLFFPAMFGGLLLPHISKAWQNHERVQARQLVEQGLTVLMLGAIFITAVLTLQAKPLITLIAGSEFSAAAPFLKILSFALATMFLGNLFGFVLVAIHKHVVLLKLYAILAVLNVLANSMLIPRWGATAAASITVATEVIATAVAAIAVWQSVRYQVALNVVVRLALVAVVTSVTLVTLPDVWHVSIPVLIAGIVCGGAAVLLGLLNRTQLNMLMNKPIK